MGKKSNRSESTQKKEPHRATISKNPNPKTTNPQKQFNTALIDMSWRVALPFMVFSLGGIKIDEKLGTEPLYSLIGVFLAIASVAVVIYKFVESRFPGTFNGGKK